MCGHTEIPNKHQNSNSGLIRTRCYIVTMCTNLVSMHYFLPLGIWTVHTNHPWGIAIFEFKFNRIGRIKRYDMWGSTTLSYPTYMGPALVRITLLLPLIPQEFTIASCLTVYHWAEQPRVELDLEITAGGSYNAKVNLPGVLQLNFYWILILGRKFAWHPENADKPSC